MTLTEAVQFDEGAGGGRIYQQRLPAGMTEIFVSVPTRAGQAALTMTTPGLIANNRYSYVSTGVSQFGGEPISYGRVQLLVILTGLCVSGATVGIMRNRRDNDDKAIQEGAMSFIQSVTQRQIESDSRRRIDLHSDRGVQQRGSISVGGSRAGVVITAGFAALVFVLGISALASSMSFYPTRTEFS